ncbi:MAG: sulfocyanin-like copper-binding protein, partial [Chloroflexota bacterium]
ATAAAARVVITFKDFSVAAVAPSAKAGDVTFEVKNDGKLPHQFVVVKSDLDPAALPLHDQKEVDEPKVQIVTRISDFDSGQSKTVAAKLAPGKYVLLCNVPSHYSSGMFTAFVVN